MAAPSSTVWGSSVSDSEGDEAKLGIYVSTSSTTSTTTVTIQVWFWSEYSVTDSVNTLYFNNEATSATTSKGSVSISHTVNSSWSTSNQTKLATYTYSYSRGSSASTKSCAAKLTGIEAVDSKTMTVSTSYTIPAYSSQKVYLCSNGYIYARAFKTATSTYIDSSGALYAPAFTTGSAIYFASSGVTAVKFVEGTP